MQVSSPFVIVQPGLLSYRSNKYTSDVRYIRLENLSGFTTKANGKYASIELHGLSSTLTEFNTIPSADLPILAETLVRFMGQKPATNDAAITELRQLLKDGLDELRSKIHDNPLDKRMTLLEKEHKDGMASLETIVNAAIKGFRECLDRFTDNSLDTRISVLETLKDHIQHVTDVVTSHDAMLHSMSYNMSMLTKDVELLQNPPEAEIVTEDEADDEASDDDEDLEEDDDPEDDVEYDSKYDTPTHIVHTLLFCSIMAVGLGSFLPVLMKSYIC